MPRKNPEKTLYYNCVLTYLYPLLVDIYLELSPLLSVITLVCSTEPANTGLWYVLGRWDGWIGKKKKDE